MLYTLGAYPHAEARFRSQDSEYLPGPAILVSESLTVGIAPPASKQQVKEDLGVARGFNSDPEKVLTIMTAAAKAWRVVGP